MPLNVSGSIWRFSSPNRGLRSKTKVGKLRRSKAWERAKRLT